MEMMTLYMLIGFLLAAYSVIGNDSVQTLGTFINSNRDVKWYWMWAGASAVLIATVLSGWYFGGGDISHGRLNKIPFETIEWYHALAPGVLLLLTRIGIPVSTSFLVLSAFASTVVLEKMLLKSAMGYAVAAIAAYVVWLVIAKILDEKQKPLCHGAAQKWRIAQWCSTGLLWYMWLSHDMANIAVFLPRDLPVDLLIGVIGVFIFGLAFMFYERGGKIQQIVIQKTDTRYVRSATLIDLFYAFVLWYFKMYNDIPMSTTWVFVGLLAGREFAIATVMDRKIKRVFPMVFKDFGKMMIGLLASVGVVLAIHQLS